jgi:hypothetical protein
VGLDMQDLMFNYSTEDGERETKEYSTIMDFLDDVESGAMDDVLECDDVNAEFFENELNTKHFDTVNDLYTHCCKIVGQED